jgi:DNA-directed RNA polymerase specialized sigma subunit
MINKSLNIINKDLKRRVDEWVTDNYEWLLGEIETNVAKDRMSQYASDLTTYLIETLYTMPEEKVSQLLDNGKVGHYLLVGAGMQLRSSTSPFYRQFRKFKMSAREDGQSGHNYSIFEKPDIPYDESLYQCFKEAMGELDFYDEALMTKYFYEEWTLQQMYEYYNISKRHIIKDINRILNQIRQHCKHC